MPLERDKDLEAVFDLHRRYIEHEDQLINHRTTWLITVQSFLIATFGFSYQKKLEVAEKLMSRDLAFEALGKAGDEYIIFLVTLACVGLITSIAAFFSIYAAVRALRALRSNWKRVSNNANVWYLPAVTGGGDHRADRGGISLSMWAPVFFFFLWTAVLIFLLIWFKIQAGAR